jgi:RimJ/RimL family protein N-acetyltransferase
MATDDDESTARRGRIVARTARQILRETTVAHAEGLFALNADPEVLRYLPPESFASIEAAREFAAGYARVYREEGFARWMCEDASTGAFLGWCGLRRQADGEVDLGYRYLRACWGRGLATEASRACLDLAFGPYAMASVIARAHPENTRSIRVMQKLGFAYETTKTFEEHEGVVYRLRAEDWRP